MLVTNPASLLPAANGKAPTLAKVLVRIAGQSSFVRTDVVPWNSSSRGSAIAVGRPNAASAGPAARTRISRAPPLTTTPTLRICPVVRVVRTERFESQAEGPPLPAGPTVK